MSDGKFQPYPGFAGAWRDAILYGEGTIRVTLDTPPCEWADSAWRGPLEATRGADGVWAVELEKTDG